MIPSETDELVRSGTPSHHSRVERWECDFNDHWNVRFYIRSFQMAFEDIEQRGRGRLRRGPLRARHVRFHKELQVNAPVEVRSSVLTRSDSSPKLLHVLSSSGMLSATALDDIDTVPESIPTVNSQSAILCLPRGLQENGCDMNMDRDAGHASVHFGPARPVDFDHEGHLLAEAVCARISTSSTAYLHDVGFTQDFTARTSINRMSIEMKLFQSGDARPGECLTGDTVFMGAKGKTFVLRHRIFNPEASLVAYSDQCLLAVDLNTRRAVDLPDVIRANMK